MPALGAIGNHKERVGLMLNGFSVPLTPSGQSSLAPTPPWHYAGVTIAMEFWANSQVVASLLPPGLLPDDDPGYSVAHFAEWQACTEGATELKDPITSQYKEFFVTLGAMLDGEPVFYCPFIYVDQDVALLRGLVQGLPKKLGSVHITRSYGVENPAASAHGPGGVFGGSLSVADRRLAEGRLQVDDATEEPVGFMTRPMVGVRHFPELSIHERARPLVNDLVRFAARNRQVSNSVSGRADLSLASGPRDELGLLAPIRVGRGHRFEIGLTIDDLVPLGRL